jgi:hypothetical protein
VKSPSSREKSKRAKELVVQTTDDIKNRLLWDYSKNEYRVDLVQAYPKVMNITSTIKKNNTIVNAIAKQVASADQAMLDTWGNMLVRNAVKKAKTSKCLCCWIEIRLSVSYQARSSLSNSLH